MKKQVLLIADDEQNIRLLVREHLNGKLSVIEAKYGEEAIDMAHRHKPGLILMDILMPGIDGYQACSIIKKDKLIGSVPVVMVSGIGYELNKKLAREMGADGYVTKPFTETQLLGSIGKFLDMVE